MSQNYETVSSYVEKVAKRLVGYEHISTILLAGSYARGDSSETSDIDIVVISEAGSSVTELSAQLPESPYRQRVSLLPFSASVFRTMYRNGNLFVRHVVKEGRVIYDDGFFKSLKREALPEPKVDALRTWGVIKELLAIYRDIEAFDNYHIYPAARLFSILKQIVVLGIAIKGDVVFNQDEAIKRFLHYYPETRSDIEILLQLRPYALLVSRHRIHPARPPEKISVAQMHLMVNSLERVIQNVEYSWKKKND